MSKYTTEVRFICEQAADYDASQGYAKVSEIIDKAIPKVFDFDFPIFDETYRNVLCTKILKHYYTREICEETVGLWKLRLDTRLNEIMPFYNKLYSSELLEFNPLYDVDLKTTNDGRSHSETDKTENQESSRIGEESGRFSESGENGRSGSNSATKETTLNGTDAKTATVSGTEGKTADDTSTTSVTASGENHEIGTTSDTGTKWDLYTDTPQGGIQNIDPDTPGGAQYLTNARKNTDVNSGQKATDTTTESTSTTNYQDLAHENTTKSETINDTTTKTSTENEEDTGSFTETGSDSKSGTNSKDTSETSATDITGNTVVNTTDGYVQTVAGKTGGVSYSKLLQEFRNTFLNIDKMILDNLQDLFITLW